VIAEPWPQDIECFASTPSGKILSGQVVGAGVVRLRPGEAGVHVVHVRRTECLLAERAFQLEAVESELPVARGAGLGGGVVGEAAVFRIVAPNNLEGSVSIEIGGRDG
jgi:hypothetical protein